MSISRHLVAIALFTLAACNGGVIPFGPSPGGGSPSGFEPCTNPQTCCPPEALVCTGNPDDGTVVCTCDDLWDCSENPTKCQKPTPKPDGGSGWICRWTESSYLCVKKGPKGEPPGGSGWSCNYDEENGGWVCTTSYPPNPSNKPGGASVWDCEVAGEELVCDQDDTPPPPPLPPPPPPYEPPGSSVWNCTKNAQGVEVCQKEDGNGGLPPGGTNWRCHRTESTNLWVCVGDGNPGTVPGGSGWNCKKTGDGDEYICVKPDEPHADHPPGGGNWACVKGTEFDGTKCEETDTPPTPPGLHPPPGPGEVCIPGTLRWCDGLQYCGWGQMTCLPDGSWPTKMLNGNKVYDCQELPDGRRPNTACGCYFFYFNADCCERPDCVVPEGTNGQICPASGGKLCDACNPQKKECKEPGGKCIVTNKGEAYCGKSCSLLTPCSADYDCLPIKGDFQCVPKDRSCYY